MPRDTHFDLPQDLDSASPDFIATLNDRLRRLSDALPAPLAAGYSGPVVTAKLTGGGATGLITFKDGRVVSQKAAT